MKTITIEEALKQEYSLCGYHEVENQTLMNISDLNEDDFMRGGIIVVAKKEMNCAIITSEEVKDWLIDRFFDVEGNPHDDSNDLEEEFKEKLPIINDFVLKMNWVYETKPWYDLDEELQLIPNKDWGVKN